MIKIKQVIVVEGKYDKIKLSRIFDTLIITTDGFYVYKSREKAEFIKNMALKNGVIILTDSDKAGFRIRNYLKNILKDADVRNAYIPEVEGKEKRKSKAGKEGLLGVEGVSDDIIINAVMSVADENNENFEKVTKTDFYNYGLCGAKNSAENRRRLAKALNLPLKISSNGLLDIINNMYSKKIFLNIINGGIKKMSIKKSNFGKVNGVEAVLLTLENKNGMTVSITNYGANVVNILVPDKNGKFDDVIIGYRSAAEYQNGRGSHGGTIGRYANRIAGGKFTLNGTEYSLALNDSGVNCLHGGNVGYNKRFWEIKETCDGDEPSVSLSYTDPDGEENFPGKVDVTVKFTVTADNGFKIEYFAKSDKDTIVNLTNHSYFNLSGYNSGNIYNHLLKMNAKYYTPTDKFLIPTGEIADVKGTMLDFTDFRRIGDGFEGEYKELEYQNGYDHNFILGNNKEMRVAAILKEENSGRKMTVFTDKPAIQLYSGNFLNGSESGKDGNSIEFRTGVCLETQFTPNSPNLGDEFPSSVLKANDEYNYTTIYKFEVE